jgi:hypothetical protein
MLQIHYDEPLKKRGYRKIIVDNYILFTQLSQPEKWIWPL